MPFILMALNYYDVSMNVAILGASPKINRYAYRAIVLLEEAGHSTFPVNPKYATIESRICFPRLLDCTAPIHTITVYVNPEHLAKEVDAIIACAPKRVIFNPGSESSSLAQRLELHGIEVVHDCTLVMLSMNRF